jgi:hypothetical protein
MEKVDKKLYRPGSGSGYFEKSDPDMDDKNRLDLQHWSEHSELQQPCDAQPLLHTLYDSLRLRRRNTA